jgi:hypothetical protein
MAQPFRSKIREMLRGRTEELERLAVEMYKRGLSVRDIEAALTDEAGRCLLSRTAASDSPEWVWADYQAFASRDLREFKVLYLFVDGIARSCTWGSRATWCLPPGASPKAGTKCFWVWRRERRTHGELPRLLEGSEGSQPGGSPGVSAFRAVEPPQSRVCISQARRNSVR